MATQQGCKELLIMFIAVHGGLVAPEVVNLRYSSAVQHGSLT
jgi:hypothetical protein